MAFIKKALSIFTDENDIGIFHVPKNSPVLLESTHEMWIKKDNVGLNENSTIQDAINNFYQHNKNLELLPNVWHSQNDGVGSNLNAALWGGHRLIDVAPKPPSNNDGDTGDIWFELELPLEKPDNPRNLVASNSRTDGILIEWSNPFTTGSKPIEGVKIYRDGALIVDTGQEINYFLDTNVNVNVTYSYHVVIYNDAGESQPSNSDDGRMVPQIEKPDAPTNLIASTNRTDGIQLVWHNPLETQIKPIDGIRIYRNDTLIKITTSKITNFIDTNVSENVIYRYRVSVYNSAGESPKSNSVSGKRIPLIEVPNAPSNLRASHDQTDGVHLTWTNPSETSTKPITGVKVYRDGRLLNTIQKTTHYLDSTAAAGVSYNYYVKVYNSAGDSLRSNDAMGVKEVQPGSIVFSTPGVHHWTVPDGVHALRVCMIGGGASGGAAGIGMGWTNPSAGAAGKQNQNTISVSPGENLTITVGAGGTPVSATMYGHTYGRPGGRTLIVYSRGTMFADGGVANFPQKTENGWDCQEHFHWSGPYYCCIWHPQTRTSCVGTFHDGASYECMDENDYSCIYTCAFGGQAGWGNGGNYNRGAGGVGSGGGVGGYHRPSGAGGRGEVRISWG